MKKGISVKLRDSVAYQLLKIVFAIYFLISVSITLGHMFMEYLSAKEMVVDELKLLQKAFEEGLSTSLFDLNRDQLRSIVDGMYNVPVLVGIKIEPVNPDIPVTPVALGAVVGPDGNRMLVDPKEKSKSSSLNVGGLIAHSFTIYQPNTSVEIARGTLYSSDEIIFFKVKDGFIRIIISAIIKTLCLWFLFLWAAHGRLSRPLRQMAYEVSQLDLKNLEGVKINVKARAGNELKILEESFNGMIQNSSRLTQSLAETARKYRMIFENANEGIFQIAPGGGIINANPAMARMFGYNRPNDMIAEVTNFAEQCYVNPGDHAEFTALVRDGQKVKGFERHFKRQDGSVFWGVASGQPVYDQHDNLLYYEGSLVDVTEQKEKIQAEKERDIAKESSRSKSEFLANMSHEIRTPMNAIVGLSHLAQKTDLTPRQRDYLRKIETSSLTLLGIINDILDFSKIEAKKLNIESIDFNLQNVLDNVVNLINLKADEKGLELLFDIAQNVPYALVGDPLRLSQVLINLAGNGIKFTEKGQILIKVENLKTDTEANKIKLKFSIIDSGIGLTQEQLKNLFQSFSQADGSTTRKYGGTGLGLSISKSLVNMMGGEISVESVYGEGSTFIFTTEFGIQPEKNQAQFVSPDTLHGMRALVVDDNGKAREILRDLLEEFRFEVTDVASGEEAISILQKKDDPNPFDLVLMDWQMGGMDGLETARRIKEDSGSARIPAILMVTAFGREEVINQASAIGLDGFLIKPVNRSLLFDNIMNLFGKIGMIEHMGNMAQQTENISNLKDISGVKMLLVEDNKLNQQVATELLGSVGIEVSVAQNGREALDMLVSGGAAFDGILMDIHMPELDGYETTRIIRENPAYSQLPIIAMTANAMAGDREKCLAVGMNDYITKPIEPTALFQTIIKWLPKSAVVRPEDKKSPEASKAVDLPDRLDGIDLEAGLRRTGGRPEFYLQLLRDFVESHGNDYELILEAFEHKDRDLAIRLVHSLKGVAGGIGAIALYESALQLEAALKENPIEELASHLSQWLQKELQKVVDGSRSIVMSDRAATEDDADPVDDGAIVPLIEEIQRMINEMDPDTADKTGELYKIIKYHHQEHAHLGKTLCVLAEDFDFEAAHETLNAIKTSLSL